MADDAVNNYFAPPRSMHGGQCFYSDLAIESSLITHLVSRQPLRHTDGLMASTFELQVVELKALDQSTVS